MIIALPAEHHDHLADALVRDLGFTRRHVDAAIRELLLEMDPRVAPGVELASGGNSPRLSAQLAKFASSDPEERWAKLLHPPHGSWAQDQIATETNRMLDVLRASRDVDSLGADFGDYIDLVLMGAQWGGANQFIAITGRCDADPAYVDHWIAPAGVVGEQEAIVAYVRSLRQPDIVTASLGGPRPPKVTAKPYVPQPNQEVVDFAAVSVVPAVMCSCGDRTATVQVAVSDPTVIGDPDATFTAWMCAECAERVDPTGENRVA